MATTTSRDKIEHHLIQQKARAVQPGVNSDAISLGEADRCQYRTDSGRMCAAGCLIPDEKYSPDMEGLNAYGVDKEFPGVLPTDIHERELGVWQNYHDTYALIGHDTYSYKKWIEGDEDHHPSKFKQAVANKPFYQGQQE